MRIRSKRISIRSRRRSIRNRRRTMRSERRSRAFRDSKGWRVSWI